MMQLWSNENRGRGLYLQPANVEIRARNQWSNVSSKTSQEPLFVFDVILERHRINIERPILYTTHRNQKEENHFKQQNITTWTASRATATSRLVLR